MTTKPKFKKGDRVVWVRADRDSHRPKGTLGVYDDEHPDDIIPWVRLDSGSRVVAELADLGHVNPLDGVKPGDVVTLRHPDGSALVDREVDSVRSVQVGKRREYLSDLVWVGWAVTAHQAKPPEPVVPTKAGSRVKIRDAVYILTAHGEWVNVKTGYVRNNPPGQGTGKSFEVLS